MQAYREVQARKPLFVYAVVGFVVVTSWYGFVQQIILGKPYGTRPAPDWVMWVTTLLAGVGLPLFMLVARLVITVTDDAVSVRYVPLMSRHIPLSEIESAAARQYSPIAEYGGWGIRGFFASGDKRAYNMSGNEGVELRLANGQQVMLGSQKPADLEAAIRARL